MTGTGRTEQYRGYRIDAQAMSAKGGGEHRARVGIRTPDGDWRGPFVDYATVFPTEDEARDYGIRLGMEVVDAEIDSRPCRWRPIAGRWSDLPET